MYVNICALYYALTAAALRRPPSGCVRPRSAWAGRREYDAPGAAAGHWGAEIGGTPSAALHTYIHTYIHKYKQTNINTNT